MDLKELQKRQAEYDEKWWQHEWDELVHLRHITLHMWKILWELSAYCHDKEHWKEYSLEKIKTAVIPDLIMHSLRLANILWVDAEKAFFDREEENKKKYFN